MKRLILIPFGSLLLTSCIGTRYDDVACAKNAKESFPGYRIYVVDNHYKYLAVDSVGNVKVLIYNSISKSKITSIEEYIELK